MVGDVVVLIEDGMMPTKWPLAKVTKTYPGRDNIVRVVDINTLKGHTVDVYINWLFFYQQKLTEYHL